MTYTKIFKELKKGDTKIAGGKGASLGEMTNAGIQVPDGFVVLTDSFNQFIKEKNIKEKIENILKNINKEKQEDLNRASKEIQNIILKEEIPKEIKEKIVYEFDILDAEFVAVRSSATAEDGLDNAWAGQLDSYLNVTKENLTESVKKCWASLYTPRAIFYRIEKELDKTDVSVAVVVQKMVNSEKSGIAFSVHPVSEDRDKIIIEAGLGLGEAIVSGSVTPDSYIISKEKKELVEKTVNDQTRALFGKKDGGNKWIELKEKGKEQILSMNEALELAEIIQRIENHYGIPQDIEWAFEGGKFYVVQSRPITTLGGGNKEIKREGEVDANEGVERILERVEKKNNNEFNVIDNFFLNNKIKKQYIYEGSFSSLLIAMPMTNSELEFPFNNTLNYLFVFNEDKTYVVTSDGDYKKTSVKVIEYYFSEKENNLTVDYLRNKHQDLYEKSNSLYEKWKKEKIDLCSNNKLSREIKKAYILVSDIIAETIYIEYVEKEMFSNFMDKNTFEEKWEYISKSYFDNFEIKRNKIIKETLDNKTIDDAINELMYIFTDYYEPKTKEYVKDYLLNFKYEEKENKNIRDIEKEKQFSKLEKKVFEYVQYVMEERDIRKEPIAKAQYVLYILAKELAKRADVEDKYVVSVNALEYSNGIEWLKNNLSEIKSRYVDGWIGIIKSNNVHEFKYTLVKNYDGVIEYIKEKNVKDFSNILKGSIGNKGSYVGRIKKILNAHSGDNVFINGDVLVTSMTRPEFVPLMKKAGAIITNEGGITSHAAIVSRELKKPCIIGTKIATQVLKDGDLVEVDANEGVVRILERTDSNDKNGKKILMKF